jgi:hypothetical protein
MDTFHAINQRRSVKAFEPTHLFTTSEETRLLEAAVQSPTSFDM